MGAEFVAYLAEQLALIWSSFQKAFLIPLPIAAIIVLLAYLWMRPRGLRSWRDLREFVFPSRYLPARTLKVDAVSFVIVTLLVAPLAKALGLAISGQLFSDLLVKLTGHPATTSVEPWLVIPLQLAVAVFFAEFGTWWGHYLHHKVPFLWEVHKAHHSSEALAFISGYRFHPMEPLLTRPLFGLVLPAIPIGTALYFTGGHLHPVIVSVFVVYGTVIAALDMLHHSPIPISFGRLSRVFASPVMHQIHHSAEPQHRDKNMGSWWAIFDWMFGTLYIPKEGEQFRFGADESELGESNPHLTARGFYLTPVVGFSKGLVASILPGQRHEDDAVLTGPPGR